ncbi:uncharacterized protein PHACADRAFT_209686 [Phanerochaete carnosa HHB-10118-sp]|uniref:Ubiquitin-like modifier-activating enzyme Atg7 N-terminal domain-containing protein n=1 Tax=Phanerochaete carnosa (strain HHB-10118-sp) TaxID=650164 RepID=K5X0B6_PHACS|nr:uncharacterized protein PHACADRAFT_209686 [Phanerochaete carnosa HHB-10118-sp]EKM56207.1 hypothetical protein PHACADRAFT_209686 [Phanerochaete carnosa HHB-10118-sp]
MTIIEFQPFSLLIEPAFWHALNNVKTDVLRLSDAFIPLAASYAPRRAIVDMETGREIAMPSALKLVGDAFTGSLHRIGVATGLTGARGTSERSAAVGWEKSPQGKLYAPCRRPGADDGSKERLTDQTLDQICAVTRPGLASTASPVAVGLLAALLQHPGSVNVPALAPKKGGELPDPHASGSVLGLVLHQPRGCLAEFRTIPVRGTAFFSCCTGYGGAVLEAYKRHVWAPVQSACGKPGFMERLTCLDELYREGEEAAGDVE